MELLFVLNDNVADGLDVSWIWDINFSIFERVTRVVTSGTRAYDIAVRIKCSGYDQSKIVVMAECGFLSNPEEAALLNTDEYQEKTALTIFAGLCDSLAE